MLVDELPFIKEFFSLLFPVPGSMSMDYDDDLHNVVFLLISIDWLIVVVWICVVVLDLYMFCASLSLENLGCVLFYCHAKDFLVNLFHLCFFLYIYSVVCCFLCSYASLASFFPFLCACFLNFKLSCPFFCAPYIICRLFASGSLHHLICFFFFLVLFQSSTVSFSLEI